MSVERFIKFIPSSESDFLQENHPNAFLLLCLIAKRARRISGGPDGLEIGEAHIGDYQKAGIGSRKQYRTALDILIKRGAIKKLETCRNRKKSATGETTVGTKVKLLKSDIWDINSEQGGHRIGHRGATDGPPMGHEQERRKNVKNEKKIFLSDSCEIGLSDFFLSLILKRKPDFKKPNIQTWAKSIDAMIRIDKRDPTEIRRVMEWVSHDSFECSNVLSIEKLRKRFDQLQEKSRKILPIKESIPSDNKSKATSILKEYMIPKTLSIELLNKHIEFLVQGSPTAICVDYFSHGFEEQVMNAIRKTGCVKIKQEIDDGKMNSENSNVNGHTVDQNGSRNMKVATNEKKRTGVK